MGENQEERVRMKTLIKIKVEDNLSLPKEIFVAIDKMVIFFLLFESILKNMTRFSRYYTDNYDNYIKKINSSAYMEDMISQLRHAS